MIVIPPIPITSSVLASSTVAEPSAGEVVWNATTSYAVGDVVIRTTTHRKYECQIAGVGSTIPENAPARWLDIGPTNTWSFPSGLEIEISAGTRVGGGVALTTQIPVSIRNLGIISGRGGIGGAGGWTFFTYAGGYYNVHGGDGVGGQGFLNDTSLTVVGPASGASGGYFNYAGPVFGGDTRPYGYGGNGGAGGTWGSPGENGSYGTVGGSFDSAGTEIAPTAGTNPANSVIGNSFITWLATGTRLGPISA